jgi:hypothetical protein
VQDDIQSFLVRVWPEGVDSEGNATVWRGSIDHVGSEKRLYFQELAMMLDFIQQEAGINDGGASPERVDLA